MSLALVVGGRHSAGAIVRQLRRDKRALEDDNQELTQRAEAADSYVHKARMHACQDAMLIARLRAERAEAIQVATGLQAQLDGKDREHADVVARIDERNGDIVRDLEDRLADLEQRLDIRTFAEAAAAKTQPIPVITAVMPLHEAPFATTNPGRLPCSWGVKDDEPEPAI